MWVLVELGGSWLVHEPRDTLLCLDAGRGERGLSLLWVEDVTERVCFSFARAHKRCLPGSLECFVRERDAGWGRLWAVPDAGHKLLLLIKQHVTGEEGASAACARTTDGCVRLCLCAPSVRTTSDALYL